MLLLKGPTHFRWRKLKETNVFFLCIKNLSFYKTTNFVTWSSCAVGGHTLPVADVSFSGIRLVADPGSYNVLSVKIVNLKKSKKNEKNHLFFSL